MHTRSKQLREQQRRILGWSLVAAVAIHVLVFALAPTFRAEPFAKADLELDSIGDLGGANALAEVFFRPPAIHRASGADWLAPPGRVLAAERDVRVERRCSGLINSRRMPRRARVRLRVRDSGRVDVLGLAESTGDTCSDQVVEDLAGALWYHWLPNDRFPAPVELTQPVTLMGVK